MSDKLKDKFNDESVELLLSTAKSEYENEHSRTSVIDSKTSIALPIISAYFLALAQMNDFKTIFNVHIDKFIDVIIPAISFLTYVGSLILSFVAVMMMVKVVTTRDYNTIKPIDLYDEDYLKNKKTALEIKLIQLYIEATQNNKTENDLRIPLYKRVAFNYHIYCVICCICNSQKLFIRRFLNVRRSEKNSCIC